jgi:NurA domain
MSLDLPRVLPQVEEMSRAAAERAAARRDLIPRWNSALDTLAALPQPEVSGKIAAAGARWPGAIPTEEPVNASFPPPTLPERMDVFAADGSQVHPDRHGSALFYLINIGSLAIRHGTGHAPETATEPHLAFDDSELYGEGEGVVASAVIDGRRDVAELAALARLAEAPAQAPTLALLDNGLLLWLALQAEPATQKQIDLLLDEYLEYLARLQKAGAAIAGFVDRPRNANVLALLQLFQPGPADREASRREAHPYRGLSDRAVFSARLAPGCRSSRFTHASPVNARYQKAGHSIQFFYLHCGGGDLARVEIPQWVGENRERLNLVHAGLLEECRTTGGFPYALARAHELAVVTQSDRQELEGMLNAAMFRRGMVPSPSSKALTKQWIGSRRRHRV